MGKKWMSSWKVMFTSAARKFHVSGGLVVAAVIAGLHDGHLSAGDKWEIVAAVAAALGVFAVPNKPAVRAHPRPHVPPND
jgi:hypothetical protein